MKKQNSFRNLLTIALLIGGIFAVGAQNQTFAQDRSGYLVAGNRAESVGSAATSSTTDSTRSGYLISTGRAESTGSSTQQSSGSGSAAVLEMILDFFF